MPDSIHIVVDALVGAAVAYFAWRFRYIEMKLDDLRDNVGKSVTIEAHSRSIGNAHEQINSLRERIARIEGPPK